LPYKVLSYKESDRRFSVKNKSHEKVENCDFKKPHLMFLVHARADSIGGVQRHSARLRDGLSNKYRIDRFNWKDPKKRLPLNFPGLYIKTRSNGFGVIYCDDGLSSIVGTNICGPLRKKIVATVHGLDIIVPLPGYQPVITRSLQKLDKVVCVSRATAGQVIKRGVKPDRVIIIPNAAEIVPNMVSRDESLYNHFFEVKTWET
jgi:hypothetical protein